MSVDPFSLVYNMLWDVLESHAGFRNAVKIGNRVKLSARNRDPIKTEVSPADLPEVRIIANGITLGLNNTSSSSRMAVIYEVGIATGDQRLTASVFPMLWEIIRALSQEELTKRLATLEWDGTAGFVKRVTVGPAAIGVTDRDLNRGIAEWSSLLSIETDLWFARSSIEPIE